MAGYGFIAIPAETVKLHTIMELFANTALQLYSPALPLVKLANVRFTPGITVAIKQSQFALGLPALAAICASPWYQKTATSPWLQKRVFSPPSGITTSDGGGLTKSEENSK